MDGGRDVSETTSSSYEKQRVALIEWLNSTLSNISLPVNASDEELRAFLLDGSVLCRILNKLRRGSVTEFSVSNQASKLGVENVEKFLSVIEEMGLPRFQVHDLEEGSMKIVIECLLSLRAHFITNVGGYDLFSTLPISSSGNGSGRRWKLIADQYTRGDSSPRGEEKRKNALNSKFQNADQPRTTSLHHVGHKFHEVFQHRQGSYADIPPAKLTEMMKSTSLDNAPTQSLLSLVNGIIDESIERKTGEIPCRVACLLRKVVQEIERRISTQAEHLRTQNNLFKAREEKYQSRIRVLEALASGTRGESQIAMNQLQQIRFEKSKVEERRKFEEQDVDRLIKQTDNNHQEIASLKQELETANKNYEQLLLQIKTEARETHEISSLRQELEALQKNYAQLCLQVDTEAKGANDILSLKQELTITKKNHELRCLQMETDAKGVQEELEERLQEVVQQLTDSRNRVKHLEAYSESRTEQLKKMAQMYRTFIELQLRVFQELKCSSQAIRHEITKTQISYLEDFKHLGAKIEVLENAAKNYYTVLEENRKLHNEVQDLKGNIRVYCRIRPFLPGQIGKQSIVEYIGENGELVVVDPSKQGREGHRSFKFNKVYGPLATQVEVYSDIQQLIQSVLDGYNVCIFAYGQTGSGKTYTMTGPDGASEENWGVNYRALKDLFQISQRREGTYTYEIGVQMVEVYNEKVRDLLTSGGSQKRLGILTASQPSGIAVPDASMQPVESTSDVMDLMEIGLKNRAKGVTSMNERSSRSHSILTIHARGTDMKTGSCLRGSLHLVDLAGSERLDRTEATGDRLKEAQHINKSLSALGDVIFSLAQKSSHIPYRNSKLTQVLQTSLGGQAKTLMFVQLNPDVTSFSESLSTLKFAERVSGVELGAARSSKEGRDVRELMEQVTSLKDTIAKKDEEIERLQLLKDKKNSTQGVNGEKRVAASLRYGASPPSRKSTATPPLQSFKVTSGKSIRGASKQDSSPNRNEKSTSISPQPSIDDNKRQKAPLRHSRSVGENMGQNLFADRENSHFSDGDRELSDRSDRDTDSESTGRKTPEHMMRSKSAIKIPRSLPKPTTPRPSTDSTRVSPGLKKSPSRNTLASKSGRKWQ